MTDQPRWGKHKIAEGGCQEWNCGPLTLGFDSRTDELQISHRNLQARNAEASPAANAERVWSRWAIGGATHTLSIDPIFPKLPVVAEPETPFMLPAGARADIFVRCPLWVRIRLLGAEPQSLTEFPIAILSKTWFGDFTEGELCWWIHTSARREAIEDPERPWLAICPVRITNRSQDPLNVERICLRTALLTLFQSKSGALWSDQTNVAYRGKALTSQVEVTGKPPAAVGRGAAILAPPHVESVSTIVARTFSSLRALSGLGIRTGD